MKKLDVRELAKGLAVGGVGVSATTALIAYLQGYPAQVVATAGLWGVAGVGVVTGLGGLGYALAQFSAGSELVGQQFGMTVGSFLGSYDDARRRGRGQVDEALRESVQDTLVTAAPIGQALRNTGGPGGAVVVDRFKLDWVLSQFVIRQHAGARISKGAMVREGVCDQRYWNLANHILIELGLRLANSTEWVSQGSEDLDLALVIKRFKVIASKRVYVYLVATGEWEPVDLYGVHFLSGRPNPDLKTEKPAREGGGLSLVMAGAGD